MDKVLLRTTRAPASPNPGQIRPNPALAASNRGPRGVRWLADEPADSAVVHGHSLGNRSMAFAGSQALEGLGLLMIGQLGLAAEPGALGPGNHQSSVTAGLDPHALVLGEGAEEGHEPAPNRCGEIQVRFCRAP